jgi:hypothetical protein
MNPVVLMGARMKMKKLSTRCIEKRILAVCWLMGFGQDELAKEERPRTRFWDA